MMTDAMIDALWQPESGKQHSRGVAADAKTEGRLLIPTAPVRITARETTPLPSRTDHAIQRCAP